MDVYRCECGRLTRDEDWCGSCTEAEREEAQQERRRGTLSRHERLQRMADSGTDTWEEYHHER